MKEQIKELRVKVDGLAQLCKELKPLKDFKIIQIPNNETIVESVRGRMSWEKHRVNSKEIEKAVDSLYLGKAWLGKLLGELGNENPYGSGYKTKEDIVPTQDVSIENTSGKLLVDESNKETFLASKILFNRMIEGKEGGRLREANHIEKVDWLRSSIEEVINTISITQLGRISGIKETLKELENLEHEKKQAFYNSWNAVNQCYNHLCEAKFNLGFEMSRIKNEN